MVIYFIYFGGYYVFLGRLLYNLLMMIFFLCFICFSLSLVGFLLFLVYNGFKYVVYWFLNNDSKIVIMINDKIGFLLNFLRKSCVFKIVIKNFCIVKIWFIV